MNNENKSTFHTSFRNIDNDNNIESLLNMITAVKQQIILRKALKANKKETKLYTLSLNNKDIICIEFDKKLINAEELLFFVNKIKNDLPKNIKVIVIPNSINVKTMNIEQLDSLLNQIQQILNEIKEVVK